MMKSNGFINATKMCIDGHKKFRHWKDNKRSKEMVAFYESKINQLNPSGDGPKLCIDFGSNTLEISEAGIPAPEINQSKVMFTIAGGYGPEDEVIRGIYVHSKLIPHIASWVSNEFAYKVGCIVDDLNTSYYKQKLEAEQEQRQAAETMLEIKQFALFLHTT
jgi:hypothetical protein